MGNLASAGDSPTIRMVMGFTNWADLNPTGIMGLHRIQAVRAAVFFNPNEFNFFLRSLLYPSFLFPGWFIDLCGWSRYR